MKNIFLVLSLFCTLNPLYSFNESEKITILLDQSEKEKQTIIYNYYYKGHSTRSLMGSFAGGVIVAGGIFALISYYGYKQIESSINQTLDMSNQYYEIALQYLAHLDKFQKILEVKIEDSTIERILKHFEFDHLNINHF